MLEEAIPDGTKIRVTYPWGATREVWVVGHMPNGMLRCWTSLNETEAAIVLIMPTHVSQIEILPSSAAG